MHMRITLDPISLQEVPIPEYYPCLSAGNAEKGLEIHFDNEENRETYMQMEYEDRKVLIGNDTND